MSDRRAEVREQHRVDIDRHERIRDNQREAIADLLAVAAHFQRTVSVIGISLLANAKKGTEFTDQPFVDEHGVHGRELDRAVSVARLMTADAPKTREALVVVEAARSNLTEAWGNALSSNTTRQALPMDLAGPVIQGEAVLEKAFERLTESATGELVAKPTVASVEHRLWWRFWRR